VVRSSIPSRTSPSVLGGWQFAFALCAELLDEEAADQEDCADCEERQRSGDRAQIGEVVEEKLGQREREQAEADEPQPRLGLS
jgi:hypothetical protein